MCYSRSPRCFRQSLSPKLNLDSLLDVKLQGTQEKAEKTAADTVVASDRLEAPETPESILLGRQRRIAAGIGLIASFPI